MPAPTSTARARLRRCAGRRAFELAARLPLRRNVRRLGARKPQRARNWTPGPLHPDAYRVKFSVQSSRSSSTQQVVRRQVGDDAPESALKVVGLDDRQAVGGRRPASRSDSSARAQSPVAAASARRRPVAGRPVPAGDRHRRRREPSRIDRIERRRCRDSPGSGCRGIPHRCRSAARLHPIGVAQRPSGRLRSAIRGSLVVSRRFRGSDRDRRHCARRRAIDGAARAPRWAGTGAIRR